MKIWLKIIHTLVSIIRILIYSNGTKIPKAIGDTISIIGNAPELDTSIDYGTCMVTNGFALNTEAWLSIKPTHYVLCDDKFFVSSCYYTSVIWNTILSRDWDMNIYMPKLRTGKDVAINHNHLYNKTTVEGFNNFVLFCTKHNLGMPSPANVLIPSLILAINMGYKEIHLYGFEFSWYKESIFGEEQKAIHCYAEPDYYKLSDLETSLYTFYRTVYGLNLIKKYAKKQGVTIINHSNYKII